MGDVDRRVVERFWEAFNDRDLSLLDDLFAEDYVNHAALPGTPPGPAGQAQLMQRLWTAFRMGGSRSLKASQKRSTTRLSA